MTLNQSGVSGRSHNNRPFNANTRTFAPCRGRMPLPPHGDWEVHPTTPWNYALDLDPDEGARSLVVEEHPLGDPVFAPADPPVTASVGGRRIAAWVAENGSAGAIPAGPVRTDASPEELRLIPYGCTNLRIAEFPTVARSVGERPAD